MPTAGSHQAVVCFEGARRALARAKVHWGRLDAERLLTDAPSAGKGYRTPEMYYKSVLKGARKIADECPKDVIFEKTRNVLCCALKTLFICAKQRLLI